MHEFNKLLINFHQRISNSDIVKIEISQEGVIFIIAPLNIKIMTDGSCRSVPFEIMNFGKYEPIDAEMLLQLLEDNFIIFDVGAHIGWYSLNFSKIKNQTQVYSFEPIPATFNYLTYNLRLNDVENVIPFNFGLAKNNQEALFYYFRGGSAIASLENLIEHENIDRISCKLRRMDDVVQEQKITKLDIIKCDVEGSELSILQGGLVTLEKLKPIIYIELYEPWCKKFDYNTSDVMSLLFGLGYKCYSAIQDRLINLTQIDNNNDKYNFFFLHTEKHKNILSKLLSN